jgi:hypothetical protein
MVCLLCGVEVVGVEKVEVGGNVLVVGDERGVGSMVCPDCEEMLSRNRVCALLEVEEKDVGVMIDTRRRGILAEEEVVKIVLGRCTDMGNSRVVLCSDEEVVSIMYLQAIMVHGLAGKKGNAEALVEMIKMSTFNIRKTMEVMMERWKKGDEEFRVPRVHDMIAGGREK